MTPEAWQRDLVSVLGVDRVREHAPLAPLTTLRAGGPADWLVDVYRAEEVIGALKVADRAGMPVTLLGGGSNVLVGDRGIRGLVIRVRHGAIRRLSTGWVRADAGVSVNGLVRWTIHRGLAGLEVWAGTPGTVGGAVYGNAHFDGRLVGECVESVGLAGRRGTVREVAGRDMEFGYDRSRLQRTGEVLLWADFRVVEGGGQPGFGSVRVVRSPIANEASRSTCQVPAACFKILICREIAFRPACWRPPAP